jgi:predicted nuclease of predicted toxin-antitoxin system
MRFLVDAQRPPALSRRLAHLGHEAEHVFDRGMDGASDSAIWTLAIDLGAAIVTKDEDFARRRAVVPSGPSIVWIRLGNTRRAELMSWFDAVLPSVLEALARGETLIEIA